MKKAYTTGQIKEVFNKPLTKIESDTCSVICEHCLERIWFLGNLVDNNSPANFNCPYCSDVTYNEYQIHRLYEEISQHE